MGPKNIMFKKYIIFSYRSIKKKIHFLSFYSSQHLEVIDLECDSRNDGIIESN